MIQKNVFELEDTPSIVGTGLVALDVLLNGKNSVPRLFAGGTCGNVLTILAWLGWRAFPVARIGADDAGRRVTADMRRWGVRLDVARLTPRAPTPIIIESLKTTSDGRPVHRFSLNCPVCGSWMPRYQPVTIEATKEPLYRVKTPSVFFFDRASRGALVLAKNYAAAGALIVYEPSGQANDDLFQEALELAHICKYSVEQFTGFRWKKDARPLLEVQTMGHEGVRYRGTWGSVSEQTWRVISASKVGVVKDTAGAGDWFSAGLIHVLGRNSLAGLKSASSTLVNSAMLFGKTLAAWNCQYEGARGGMYAVSKAEFLEEIRDLLSGQTSPSIKHKMRSARLTNFRCPTGSCRVRSL